MPTTFKALEKLRAKIRANTPTSNANLSDAIKRYNVFLTFYKFYPQYDTINKFRKYVKETAQKENKEYSQESILQLEEQYTNVLTMIKEFQQFVSGELLQMKLPDLYAKLGIDIYDIEQNKVKELTDEKFLNRRDLKTKS
ncbi:MAG: hypothetical protein GY810_28120 [Aureispira sp.]|nr:hypothetical protein [Aureispira sp.]